MQVFVAQWDLQWEAPEKNLEHFLLLLNQAAPPPGSLVVLPEMAPTGFTNNLERWGLPLSSVWETMLSTQAQEKGIAFVLGIARLHSDGKARNDAVFIDPSGTRGHYSKMRPFTGAREHETVEVGRGVAIFEWQGVRICPLICYDLRFPEVFRLAALKGVDIFAVIASWPSVRRQHWITLLQARAIENISCVVGVNRGGKDPFHSYSGDSMLIDHMGKTLLSAGDTDCCLGGEFQLETMHEWRRQFPALSDLHSFPLLIKEPSM